MDKPSPVTGLLRKPGFPAEGVLQRGRFLLKLDHLLRSILDHESSLHCRVGNVRDGLLILYTDSAAWATRLRYQTPALLQQLQTHKGLQGLQKIELRVLPEEKKLEKNQRVEMSSAAASCLSACADTVAGEDLRKALQRLASHHAEKTS